MTMTLSSSREDTEPITEASSALPSLVSCGSVVSSLLSRRQEAVLGTNLGVLVLDLRSRAALQVFPLTHLLPDTSQFSSMASCLTLASTSSSLAVLFQGSEDRKVRVAWLPLLQRAAREVEDLDLDLAVISLEDENANPAPAPVTVIPKDQIRAGSLLDLDTRAAAMAQQSLGIMRAGSLPIHQIKKNIRIWHSAATATGQPK